MKPLLIEIAEHLFRVRPAAEWVREWLAGSFAVRYEAEADGLEPHMTVDIEDGCGVPFAGYDVDVREEEGATTYRRADYFIRIDSSFRNAHIGVYDAFALKHAMMNLYSAYIVHHSWGLLVHSSCVVERGRAYLFSGYSGAGKSTVAKLSMPRQLLSDEATIVKLCGPGGAIAFDSPFRSELETHEGNRSYPLHGVYFLRQSQQVLNKPLSKGEGFLCLTDKVFYWSRNPQETAKIFRLCRRLIDSTPTYDLYFQKNDSFWEMIS
jgi:hypothetical protein